MLNYGKMFNMGKTAPCLESSFCRCLRDRGRRRQVHASDLMRFSSVRLPCAWRFCAVLRHVLSRLPCGYPLLHFPPMNSITVSSTDVRCYTQHAQSWKTLHVRYVQNISSDDSSLLLPLQMIPLHSIPHRLHLMRILPPLPHSLPSSASRQQLVLLPVLQLKAVLQ